MIVVISGVLVALPSAASGRLWAPAPRTTWQWQLTTPVSLAMPAQMFDIDLFDNSASVVAALHRRGRHAICYLDAGTYENYRPDARRFPSWLLGRPNGWPGERWLDIRRLSALEPIMRARFSLCRHKGFDGVEADNVDAFANDSGFPLTAAQQLTYNRWLARTAHSFGLSIALKNDLDQVPALEPYFDFALDEQCFEYSECGKLRPFVAAHKAVFEVEYNLPTGQFCTRANALGFMSMRKTLDLGVRRQVCW
ncbi:MAG: endo alpha-1,4 polygalactosaminidase [Mycobacteriaceae bacterium]|nr:endo alpha-1,4 polygalactosaminidase [Mycobacteriaceae bacterium]